MGRWKATIFSRKSPGLKWDSSRNSLLLWRKRGSFLGPLIGKGEMNSEKTEEKGRDPVQPVVGEKERLVAGGESPIITSFSERKKCIFFSSGGGKVPPGRSKGATCEGHNMKGRVGGGVYQVKCRTPEPSGARGGEEGHMMDGPLAGKVERGIPGTESCFSEEEFTLIRRRDPDREIGWTRENGLTPGGGPFWAPDDKKGEGKRAKKNTQHKPCGSREKENSDCDSAGFYSNDLLVEGKSCLSKCCLPGGSRGYRGEAAAIRRKAELRKGKMINFPIKNKRHSRLI